MFISYKEQVCQVLQNHVMDSFEIAIYPFGYRGQQVKQILNTEFQIKETYLVDNYYTGEIPVLKVKEFLKVLSEGMLILLCCENDEIKKQIRDTLSEIPESQIIDVFPKHNIYVSSWKDKSIEGSTLEDMEKLYHGLKKLVFEEDVTVYSLIKPYEKNFLMNQFEIYCVQQIKNRSLQRAYSLLLAVLLKELQVEDGEYLVGKAAYRQINNTYPTDVYEEIYYLEKNSQINSKEAFLIKEAYEMRLFTRFPGGHTVPGYEMILKSGINRKMSEIKNKYIEEREEKEKKLFYESQLIVIRALQELIKRYADASYRSSSANKKLLRVARNCEHIAYKAPRSFEQALQLLWLSHELMILEGNIKGISLGRMDQYLYPFYKHDFDQNVLNKEFARKLIYVFWKKLSFDRRALSFQNVTIGGEQNEKSKDGNPLTILFLEAQMETRANQPMLSLRTNKFTSKKIWDKALEVISTGMGMPALFIDEMIIQAKMRCGISQEDAENYSIVGCVEPAIGGKEYSHTEGLRLNVAKLLELMFFEGQCPVTGKKYALEKVCKLKEYSDFDSFYHQFKRELFSLIQKACHFLNQADLSYGENWPAPYMSLFMEETLKKGRDVARKGTKYSNLSINFAGMANVVNSLIAVKIIVYEKKLISLSEVPMILSENFEGYKEIEKEICDIPKYGNNKKIVDELMQELTELIISAADQGTINEGRLFQTGFYTVVLHAEMGKYMLASFDGRKERTALASSLSPTQGTDIRGPLAVFQSVCKTPMNKMSNGMVLDLRFSPDFFTDEKKERLKESILTYFSMGGMEVQLNVVDQETLNQAQLYPDKYRNLLVRVSGFSTYFVELEKEVQDEIILRYMNTEL